MGASKLGFRPDVSVMLALTGPQHHGSTKPDFQGRNSR